MLRKVLRGLLLVLVAGYAVSIFWTGWIDRLPATAQTVVYALLAGLVVLDVAAFASPTVARFLDGRKD